MQFRFPWGQQVDSVDPIARVFAPDVLPDARLGFALILAIRTLESWLLAAVVLEMSVKISLPAEGASTVSIWAGELQSASLVGHVDSLLSDLQIGATDRSTRSRIIKSRSNNA